MCKIINESFLFKRYDDGYTPLFVIVDAYSFHRNEGYCCQSVKRYGVAVLSQSAWKLETYCSFYVKKLLELKKKKKGNDHVLKERILIVG